MPDETDVRPTPQAALDGIDANPSRLDRTDASSQNLDDADSRPRVIDEIIAELERGYTGRLPERAHTIRT